MKNQARRKEILLLIVSVGFAFGMGEFAARRFLPHPYKIVLNKVERGRGMPRLSVDPEIGWVNTPEDATYHFQATGRFGATDAIYHVQKGFRAASAQPPAGPVIVAAGCSFTFGVGVNDEDTWPWQLQEKLPGYRVLNAGTNNYGMIQSVLLADRIIKSMPDQVRGVILGFAEFHLWRDQASQAYLYNSYPTGRPRIVRKDGQLVNKGLIYFWTPGAFLQRSDLVMTLVNRTGDLLSGTPSYPAARDLTIDFIRDFAERSRRKHILVAVAMLPNYQDQGAQEKEDHAYVKERLRQAGISVYVPDFPRLNNGQIDRDKYTIRSDGFHPTREYNVIVGGGLSGFLQPQMASR